MRDRGTATLPSTPPAIRRRPGRPATVPIPKRFYSVTEVAMLLGISPHKVWVMIHTKALPAIKVGAAWRISIVVFTRLFPEDVSPP